MIQAKPKGRPAAADATPKALKAAQKILLTEGFARLSVERVAAMTGLGKPTLYRRWSNAADLAIQALLEMAPPLPSPAGPNLNTALLLQLQGLIAAFDSDWGRQVVLVLAACDPEVKSAQDFAQTLLVAPRTAGALAFEAAIASGEIAAPPDLSVLLDMLYAPILSRILLNQPPLGPALATALVQTALMACPKTTARAPKPARSAPPKTLDLIDLIEEPRQGSLF